MQPPTLGYRPALDGLRAIAVILVMGSHVHPSALKGGAIGVDVFFALSGFLITTLVLEETHDGAGAFGFRSFYIRRSLRLFPALYAVLAFSAIYLVLRWDRLPEFLESAKVTDPDYRNEYIRYLVASATYTSNFFELAERPANFLGHTWSLAVEEQFYLLWPAIAVGFWRRSRSEYLMIGLASFIGACLVLRLLRVEAFGAFLWMRPEAIAAGALVGLARFRFPGFRLRLERSAGWLAPTALLAILAVSVAAGNLFPLAVLRDGLSTAVALLSAALVAALAVEKHSSTWRLLELRSVVWIGTASYGIYLWHLPIFRFVAWEAPALPGSVLMVLRVAISLAIATISLYVIERPFRMMQKRFRRPTPAAAGHDTAESTAAA